MARVTEIIHQEQDKQRAPAHHKSTHDGDHSLEEPDGPLVALHRALHRVLADVPVDGKIEAADGQEDDEENDQREQDVALGVQRQKS